MNVNEQIRSQGTYDGRGQAIDVNANTDYRDQSRTLVDRLKRISWSSIFAGALVALMVQVTLSLLGLGIGLSTINPTTETNAAEGLGTGAAIWYAVSSLIALFIGGWVAGRLARSEKTFDGILHGILTWSILTLLTFYLVTTTIGNVVGGVGRLIGGTMRTAGTVTSNSPELQSRLQQGQRQLEQVTQDVSQQAQSPQTQQRAREVTEQAANAVSTASLIAFVGLLLGACAAGWGARQGTLAREHDNDWVGREQPALG